MSGRRIVAAYRLVTVGVLLVGLALDLGGIVWGVEPVARTLFTAPVEAFGPAPVDTGEIRQGLDRLADAIQDQAANAGSGVPAGSMPLPVA